MLPKILIITPFRNESHSIEQYINTLQNLTYPKDRLELFWLENDSSDDTWNKLLNAKNQFSVILKQTTILGKQKKQELGKDGKPLTHVKDTGYGENRVKSWLTIWNDYFLPIIHKSDADYILMWYADCIPPSNVIEEYLKVYDKYNAGWVGGSICSRYPNHEYIRCPIPRELAHSKNIEKVYYVGHCWMMPNKIDNSFKFYRPTFQQHQQWASKWKNIPKHTTDMHMCLIQHFENKGLNTYYQPSVFLQHISTDGKVYQKTLPNKLIEWIDKTTGKIYK